MQAVGALHVETAVTQQGLHPPTRNRDRMSPVKGFLHDLGFLSPAKTYLCFFARHAAESGQINLFCECAEMHLLTPPPFPIFIFYLS